MKYLSIETIKLFRLANYIMLGLLVVLAMLFAYGGMLGVQEMMAMNLEVPSDMNVLSKIEEGIQKVTHIVLAIFIIINIGKEFSESTLKRSIIDGLSRREFYLGKVLITAVIITAVYILQKLIVVAGAYFIGAEKYLPAFLAYKPLLKSYASFVLLGVSVLFLIFLTRSIAFSIVGFFLWAIAEGIIIVSYTMMSMKHASNNSPQNIDLHNPAATNIGGYLPMTSVQSVIDSVSTVPTHNIIMAAIYFAIFIGLPYFIFLKKDIK